MWPGNSTNVLKQYFPHADLIGIDRSETMISKAKSDYPEIQFDLCSAENMMGTYDLLFSNACLQWIPNHQQLIPMLMEKLNENGHLVVQVPMNIVENLFVLCRRK